MNVYLTKPKLEDKEKLRDYCLELSSVDDAEGTNSLYIFFLDDAYEEWVSWCQSPNLSTYLIMNDLGNIVGIINIRYKLSNMLKKCGGNVGYNIRPSERRKGYAKLALGQILSIASSRGLDELFIDCYEDNEGSLKTIESVGGVRDLDFHAKRDGHQVLRYRFDLKKVNVDNYDSPVSRIERVPKAIINETKPDTNMVSVDDYSRKKNEVKMRLALEYLLELLRINPNLSGEMISPDLVQYLGLAKREYKKEQVSDKESRKK